MSIKENIIIKPHGNEHIGAWHIYVNNIDVEMAYNITLNLYDDFF